MTQGKEYWNASPEALNPKIHGKVTVVTFLGINSLLDYFLKISFKLKPSSKPFYVLFSHQLWGHVPRWLSLHFHWGSKLSLVMLGRAVLGNKGTWPTVRGPSSQHGGSAQPWSLFCTLINRTRPGARVFISSFSIKWRVMAQTKTRRTFNFLR